MITVVHRPARSTDPLVDAEPEELPAPPQLPDGQASGGALRSLLPVVGAVSSVVMMVMLRGSNPAFMVIAALVFVVALVSGLGMAFTQRAQAARTRRTQRERFLDYLEELREDLRSRAERVRERALHLDPAPSRLPTLVNDPARLWERRRTDDDFLRLRVGVGDVPFFRLVIPPESNPVQPADPLMAAELRQVADRYATVPGMPLTVPVGDAAEIALVGDRADTLAIARAMAAQAAALHSPDDVQIAAAFAPDVAADWSGLDLFPHLEMPERFDGPVRARRIAPDAAALTVLLRDELADRAERAAVRARSVLTGLERPPSRLLIFLDEHGRSASGLALPPHSAGLEALGVTLVHLVDDRLDEPGDLDVRVTASGGRVSIQNLRRDVSGRLEPEAAGLADTVSVAVLTATAREAAPLRPSLSEDNRIEEGASVDVLEALGIADPTAVDPAVLWRERAHRDFLAVPIGVDDSGSPLQLDLKESAQLGMGPHGICIGATGSGKSELLRTLVLALAATHSPDDLAMILVDYKGGAAFAPFTRLGHIAGLMDNLESDPLLTRRARESIAGEVRRRQEVLRDADNSPNITHYRELRRTRPELPVLPHLLLVIDEFGELLTAEPDFVDLLLMIGRIGRSIGVHLLLSSQRIEAGKLRGLDTYLSYRLGLRTFSESESQVVLDTSDAFRLPAVPGFGYLKVDTSVYTRFRAAYVSGAVEVAGLPEPQKDTPATLHVLPVYNELEQAPSEPESDDGDDALPRIDTRSTLVDEVVRELATSGTATNPVWLAPLPSRVALGNVLDAQGADGAGELSAHIGLLDDPSHQRQAPWRLDLTRGGGNVAVIGSPQSGRTTFLRTLATSLALGHTPREVSIYGMDLSGGGLNRIEGFPHVGGVATRADRGRLSRLVEELQAMIRLREDVFRRHGIDSMAMLRTRHAAGDVPELVAADIVLLIDGYGALRTEFEELEDPIADLLQRGGSFGIHIVMALTRWNELRMSSQPLIGQRIELRINDPADSTVSRKAATALRSAGPGRALTESSLYGQVALPVLDEVEDERLGEALEALAERSRESWSGPAAAPIRLLPESFDPRELPDPLDEPDLVPFGLRQDTMEPVLFDPLRDQHLLVFGDTESGKTTLLRGIASGFIDRSSPDELVLAVMDIRGGAAEGIPEEYLGGHAANGRDARGLAEAIAVELDKRSSGAETGPRPRIVVLVDDFDILESAGTDALSPLLPYLPSARDLGLNVLLTRPVGGATRALYNPALQSIRDAGGSGLIMSGERSEGAIYPRVYAEQFPPGRGRLVRRGSPPRIVQVAHFTARRADDQADPATEGARHAP